MKRLSDLRRRQLADIEQRYGVNESSAHGLSHSWAEPVKEPRPRDSAPRPGLNEADDD